MASRTSAGAGGGSSKITSFFAPRTASATGAAAAARPTTTTTTTAAAAAATPAARTAVPTHLPQPALDGSTSTTSRRNRLIEDSESDGDVVIVSKSQPVVAKKPIGDAAGTAAPATVRPAPASRAAAPSNPSAAASPKRTAQRQSRGRSKKSSKEPESSDEDEDEYEDDEDEDEDTEDEDFEGADDDDDDDEFEQLIRQKGKAGKAGTKTNATPRKAAAAPVRKAARTPTRAGASAAKPTAASPAKPPAATMGTKRSMPLSTIAASAEAGGEEGGDREDSEQQPAAKKPRWNPNFQRAAPPRLGEKPIPSGDENCLNSMAFCLTGTLDSMTREQAEELIKRHGGMIKSGVSRNVTHMLIGDLDVGEAKLKKLEGLPQIKRWKEDDLLNFIRSHPAPGQKAVPASQGLQPSSARGLSAAAAADSSQTQHSISLSTPAAPAVAVSAAAVATAVKAQTVAAPVRGGVQHPAAATSASDELWVNKYAPKTAHDMVGNLTTVSRIRFFLTTAQQHQHGGRDGEGAVGRGPKKSSKGEDLEAAMLEKHAILLGGPPGIGKTTAARLVAQECGFDTLEFNASDARSKNMIRDVIKESIASQSISGFAHHRGAPGSSSKSGPPKRVCLVMDEVDGMSAGDRGGIAELIELIKEAKVPVICICNDLYAQKLKSLKNYAVELKFMRPTFAQMKPRLAMICAKEGISVNDATLEKIVMSANHDFRSILNQLQMFAIGHRGQSLSYSSVHASVDKDVSLSVFDAGAALFAAPSPGQTNKTKDALDCFFADADLIPLWVFENYANFGTDAIQTLRIASNMMSLGDACNDVIRQQGRWDLMPNYGYFSSVAPGFLCAGRYRGARGPYDTYPRFPALLGKMSSMKKSLRQNREVVASHEMRRYQHQTAVPLLFLLRHYMTAPLVSQGAAGIDGVLTFMDEYGLTREDFDSVFELAAFKGMEAKDLRKDIETRVKTAFTRAYNQRHTASKRKVAVPSMYEEEALAGAIEKEAAGEGEGEDEEYEATQDGRKRSGSRLLKDDYIVQPKAGGRGKAGSNAPAAARGRKRK